MIEHLKLLLPWNCDKPGATQVLWGFVFGSVIWQGIFLFFTIVAGHC